MNRINKIQDLLNELTSLFHEKLGTAYRDFKDENIKCKKNQKKALLIASKHEKITASELGKKLEMEKGSLTSLVDSLQALGFIEKENDPVDRRKALLSLTSQGNNYVKAMRQAFKEHLLYLLADKSDDEIDEFLNSLEKVILFLKKL